MPTTLDDAIAAIQAVTAATTTLTGAVNVKKAVLDDAVALVESDPNLAAVGADLLGANKIGTVAGIAGEIVDLAPVAGSISTLAPHVAELATLAPIAGAITTTAGIAAAVSSVASNASYVSALGADFALGGNSSLLRRAADAALTAIAGLPLPNIYATALPRGVTSGTIGGTAITGATVGTYALTPTGGSITGVQANLVVTSATAASIVIINPGLGSGTTPPTWAKPAGATLPAGTTITAVVAPLVAQTGRYTVLASDGLSFQTYSNDGTSTPAIVAGASAPRTAYINQMVPLNANNQNPFIQVTAIENGSYAADGTVSVTTGTQFLLSSLPPDILAAQAGGTASVTFYLEVVSGTLTTKNFQQYTLPNTIYGGGTATTTALDINSDGTLLSITLTPFPATTQSLRMNLIASGTAVVKPMGYVIGGVPARVPTNTLMETARALAMEDVNEILEISHTEAFVASGGGTTMASGTLTLPNGGGTASVDYICPKAAVDGDTITMTFRCDVPPGSIMQVATRYGAAGGLGNSASAATPVVKKFGRNDYYVVCPVLSSDGTSPFYGIRIAYNNTSSITRVLSRFRIFKGSVPPVMMKVPALARKYTDDAVAVALDIGRLKRRIVVLGDSVMQSPTSTFTSACVYLRQYLGGRATVKNYAVPGSGTRAMMTQGGVIASQVTIPSNEFPTSGSVAVSSWVGDPLTLFYTAGGEITTTAYLNNLRVNIRITAWTGSFFPSPGSFYLDRVDAGPVWPVPAGSKLVTEQGYAARDDFVILEGSINGSSPALTNADAAAAFFAARDALTTTNKSLYITNLSSVPGTPPVAQNTGTSGFSTYVSLYGATRVWDINAPGVPGGVYLTTAERALMVAAGVTFDSTDEAFMALGHRPPSLAQSDRYHPNDPFSLLLGYRIAFLTGVQAFMDAEQREQY